MPLVELNLDGNRLCDSFREKADYIRYWEGTLNSALLPAADAAILRCTAYG